MKGPRKQHIVPKTYLKRFSIDPSDRGLRSFVWIKTEVRSKTVLSKESIDSDKFKVSDFYSVAHEDNPFVVESYFQSEVEPLYNTIMEEVHSETNLSAECRDRLILWLYNIKYRNVYNRENIHRNLQNLVHHTESFRTPFNRLIDPTPSEHQIDFHSKQIHLHALLRQDLLTDFEKGMATKHWIVLKSRPTLRFITSDNPGFSINIDLGMPDLKSLTSYFATNCAATNYFVLSPNYCVMISAFWNGTPLELNLKNQTIEFTVTNQRHIGFINFCTSATRNRLLIAHDKKLLE